MYCVINLQSITRAYGRVDADGSKYLLGDHLIIFVKKIIIIIIINKMINVEVKSFPTEAFNHLACNTDGTYIVGGGVSGHIYLWEVETGTLLKKWHGHYRPVTCLVFSNDQSLLISRSEDGTVRVWSLLMIFDEEGQQRAGHLYEYNFTGHALPITDIVTGCGGSNAIILSASLDHTCKVWSLNRGTLLRNIVFPSIIDAVALDPGEHVFMLVGQMGKYTLQNSMLKSHPTTTTTMVCISLAHYLIKGIKAICSLGFTLDGYQLVVGSEVGMVRVWDTKTCNIIRVFKHAKGPVNNIVVMRQPAALYPRIAANNNQGSMGRRHAHYHLHLRNTLR
uniref:Neurobeachin beta-propeller domain-containing protein n=1 Tax=Lactuca sativa TaxID=4236 RepID=A0A9R1WYJ8_LACSA|nr:hypothetical protein LSAT_V11C800453670 [Lactuca sativa]